MVGSRREKGGGGGHRIPGVPRRLQEGLSGDSGHPEWPPFQPDKLAWLAVGQSPASPLPPSWHHDHCAGDHSFWPPCPAQAPLRLPLDLTGTSRASRLGKPTALGCGLQGPGLSCPCPVAIRAHLLIANGLECHVPRMYLSEDSTAKWPSASVQVQPHPRPHFSCTLEAQRALRALR